MESKRRRIVSCGEEDRISNLPEHLIDSILKELPVEDAVRTSILSKKWKYKWTRMRELVFDEYFSDKFSKNGAFGLNGFIRIINQIMILHEGCISKFQLHIPELFLDSFQEVNQWMLLLSRKRVRKLILTNWDQRYELSSHVFSFLELTKLELENCFFKPPLEFKGFPNLKKLCLEDIDFGASKCGTEIHLPQLKKLYLSECTNVYNFNIKATKLRNLTAIACSDAMLLQLLNSSCLIRAVIYLQKPIQDFVRVEKMDLDRMFSNLARISSVRIDGYFLKFLFAEKITKLLPQTIDGVKSFFLEGLQLADFDQLYGAFCLLQSSPNLETLHMVMKATSVDVGPASNHLESPNCLNCTLNRLQTVEIQNLQGSKAELLIIKFLLAHSPSLEKLNIKPSGASAIQKRPDIAKDLMQFPRASPKAKVFYLDGS